MPRGGTRVGAGRRPLRAAKLTNFDKAEAEHNRSARSMATYAKMVDQAYGVKATPTEAMEKSYGTAHILREARRQKYILPLEYMLNILNNPEEADDRRFAAAMAAAPYCHPKYAAVTFNVDDDKHPGTDLDGILATLAGRLIEGRSSASGGVLEIIDQRPSGETAVRVDEVLEPTGAAPAEQSPVDRVVSVRRSRFR